MSSTAIVMQLLEEQGRSAAPVGRVALSVLLFQDLMVAPVLFGVEVLGRGGRNVALALASALLQAAVVVSSSSCGPLCCGRLPFRGPHRQPRADHGDHAVHGARGRRATGHAGLSTALGAFLAGLLLSETEYRHQVEIDLAPFKGLLIGLFFMAVGCRSTSARLGRDRRSLSPSRACSRSRRHPVRGEPCARRRRRRCRRGRNAAGAGRRVRLRRHRPRGVSGSVAAELAQLATAVVGISMMVTPLCAFRPLARAPHAHVDQALPASDGEELQDHVVIGGYGRVGQRSGACSPPRTCPSSRSTPTASW